MPLHAASLSCSTWPCGGPNLPHSTAGAVPRERPNPITLLDPTGFKISAPQDGASRGVKTLQVRDSDSGNPDRLWVVYVISDGAGARVHL